MLAARCALGAQVVLIAMVGLSPWFFGAVQLRDQQWLFAAAAIALALAGARLVLAPSGPLPWAVAPLAAGVLVGALQLVPLPSSALETLSPAAARVRSELSPTAVPAGAAPLSLYPASTRRDLSLLLLALAVFTAGAIVFSSPRAGLALCLAVACAGAALAFFEIAQHLTRPMGWRNAWSDASHLFGPFINRNNAAGHLNMCLGGALAVVVWAGTRAALASPGWPASGWRRLLGGLAHLDAVTLACLALAACIVAGVLCSMSRGGMLAMVGAAVFTSSAVLIARRTSAAVFWLGVVAVAGIGLVAWVGMTGKVEDRLRTLIDPTRAADARIAHWGDGLKAAGDFWATGSGLGTYRFIYPLYQQRCDEDLYYHAENQLLEGLVEEGVVGVALLVAMAAIVGTAAWRLIVESGSPERLALGVAGLFALTTQALQGQVDFGLYIPANMLLCAVICGAVTGATAMRRQPLRARPFGAAWPLLLLIALVWGGLEVRAAAAVEQAVLAGRYLGTEQPVALRTATERLRSAVAARPDDAEGQQALAALWINRYRSEASAKLRAELGAKTSPSRLAELTSLIALHQRAHELTRNQGIENLAALAAEPVVRNALPQAAACALAAARACPLLAESHLVLAELAPLGGDPTADQVHLSRVRRLRPGYPETLFVCGLLEFQAGRSEQAGWDWRRSLTLNTRRALDVLRLAEERMSLPYLLEKVLPDSPRLLIYLARTRYTGPYHGFARRLLAERSLRLLERSDLADDERHHLGAAAHLVLGQQAEATAAYKEAVALRPLDPAWHYELALLLKEQGKLDEAHEQARVSTTLEPANGTYRNLLRQIIRARLTGTN